MKKHEHIFDFDPEKNTIICKNCERVEFVVKAFKILPFTVGKKDFLRVVNEKQHSIDVPITKKDIKKLLPVLCE